MVEWWVWILVAATALVVLWRLKVIRIHRSRTAAAEKLKQY